VAILVRYFAVVRQRLQRESEELEARPGLTIQALREELRARHPVLDGLWPSLKLALNQELAADDQPVVDGDEVAILPPVSGGAGTYRVTEDPLSLDEVVRAVTTPAHGGLVTFTGLVRRESRGKQIVRLEYEAYVPMAERALRAIGDALGQAWPGVRVAIVHRVGRLSVGEAAVAIAVSAPHRAQAFEACRAAIDRLKESVPIWKKEIAEDGEEWIGLGP
jgi:molybdopterin synthase catalytic subunit